jgi:arabinofuranosyltransferase
MLRRWPVWIALAVMLAALVRTCWLCDDAYITVRVVDNLIHGHGLRWNVDERVQAYTHPLWLFAMLLARGFTGEFFYSLSWLCILTSLAAAALLAFSRPERAPWAIALLVLSKGYLSFATSGLEGPLAHLLLIAFVIVFLRGPGDPRRQLTLALLASLILINRLDALFLIAPALAIAFWQERTRDHALRLLIGFSPLIAWELFSLVYYGFFLPNTGPAKLDTGIALDSAVRQGWKYVRGFGVWDRLGALTIWLAVAAALWQRRARPIAIAVGLGLSVAWTIRVGGDFMQGRFLAAPVACAVALLAHAEIDFVWLRRAAIAFPLIGLYSANVGWIWPWMTASRGFIRDYVSDERVYYYPTTGLLANRPPPEKSYLPSFGMNWVKKGVTVAVENCIGQVGYYAGPSVHVIDDYALADALLARLPVIDKNVWRAGHFQRKVPAGYQQSWMDHENEVEDPSLKQYWGQLEKVVAGPIFSASRWRAIWGFHTGEYEPLRQAYLKHP